MLTQFLVKPRKNSIAELLLHDIITLSNRINVLEEAIKLVQQQLDETARECLRYVSNHNLTAAQNQKLAKFIFGCMNQKHELPRRIERHGSGEIRKVLKFIAAACEVLLEIEQKVEEK